MWRMCLMISLFSSQNNVLHLHIFDEHLNVLISETNSYEFWTFSILAPSFCGFLTNGTRRMQERASIGIVRNPHTLGACIQRFSVLYGATADAAADTVSSQRAFSDRCWKTFVSSHVLCIWFDDGRHLLKLVSYCSMLIYIYPIPNWSSREQTLQTHIHTNSLADPPINLVAKRFEIFREINHVVALPPFPLPRSGTNYGGRRAVCFACPSEPCFVSAK